MGALHASPRKLSLCVCAILYPFLLLLSSRSSRPSSPLFTPLLFTPRAKLRVEKVSCVSSATYSTASGLAAVYLVFLGP